MVTGRPLKFKTVEELDSKLDSYFTSVPKDEWTWTGLAIHLDTSRETLSDYKARPEFSDSIRKAMDKVAESYELDLKKYGRVGTIFALKNYKWTDKVEQAITLSSISIDNDIANKNQIEGEEQKSIQEAIIEEL